MQRFFVTTVSIFVLAATPATARQASTQAAFSPSPEAIALVTNTIAQAEDTIEVAAYSFTSYEVSDALIDAQQHGVQVRVVLDKSQAKRHYKAIIAMRDAGIPVRINYRYAIMHNKYVIIDGKTVETGSFNYTESATHRNAENVIVIRNNKKIAQSYSEDWQALWDEAEEF